MAKMVKQLRYFGKGGNSNLSSNIFVSETKDDKVIYPNIIQNFAPVVQLGIQTIPGVSFTIGNSDPNVITIGPTGVFQLDVDGFSEITQLRLAGGAELFMNNNPIGFLIIDFVYDADIALARTRINNGQSNSTNSDILDYSIWKTNTTEIYNARDKLRWGGWN